MDGKLQANRVTRHPEPLDAHEALGVIDPTALPLRPGTQHSAALFGAIQDCGPDRWGQILIERAVL